MILKSVLKYCFSIKVAQLITLMAMLLVVGGCAGHRVEMAPVRSDTKLTNPSEALVLFSIQVEHSVKPSMQPEVTDVIFFTEPDEEEIICYLDEDALIEKPDGSEYLLRIPLPEGRYNLRLVGCTNGNFLMPGVGIMPVLGEFDVKSGTVTYIGRLEGRTRERVGDEFRAGPIIPLIDQAVRGWSGATWDVFIKDAADIDIPKFRMTFPALKEVNIEKQILPPFNREKAQDVWESSVSGFIP